MSYIAGALLLAIVFIFLFPETPFGRWLHYQLVENPITVLQSLERTHFIYLFVGLIFVQSYAAVMPLEVATMLAWDMSLYLEAAIVSWAAASLAKINSVCQACKQKTVLWLNRLNRQKPRDKRRQTTDQASRSRSANDNEDPDQWPMVA